MEAEFNYQFAVEKMKVGGTRSRGMYWSQVKMGTPNALVLFLLQNGVGP